MGVRIENNLFYVESKNLSLIIETKWLLTFETFRKDY
ncbi:alpha-galactosidase [Streptococcus pneumoniae]|nr:alpha-galactosidase [Streptococcus pneumoniae]